MDISFFDLVIYFAFERLLEYEDKRFLTFEQLHEYRLSLLNQLEKKYVFLSSSHSKETINLLNRYFLVNEEMSLEEEKSRFKKFLEVHNKYFTKSKDGISLNDTVGYGKFTLYRCEVQEKIDNSVGAIISGCSDSFESCKILGIKTIIQDAKKLIDLEDNLEKAYINHFDETFPVELNVLNYFVKYKLLVLAISKYQTINGYHMTMLKYRDLFGTDYENDLVSTELIENDNFFVENMFINEELNNVHQSAIFSKGTLIYKKILDYIDDIWDFRFFDTVDVEEEDNNDLSGYYPDEVDDGRFTMNDARILNKEKEDLQRAKYKFYVNYIDKINKVLEKESNEDLINTKYRLLYSLNSYDQDLYKEDHFNEVIKSTNNISINNKRSDFYDFYVISRIFLIDLITGNMDDENNFKKMLFISTYYDLTHDKRILLLFRKHGKKTLKDKYYNAIINHQYDLIDVSVNNKELNKNDDE